MANINETENKASLKLNKRNEIKAVKAEAKQQILLIKKKYANNPELLVQLHIL